MPRTARIRYDVHPSIQEIQNWIKTLSEKTGRSLDQWMSFIRREGPADEAAARAWLKEKHELGTNTAWWLVERAFAKDLSLMDDDPDRYLALAPKYVAEQYSGKKASLMPIFERLYALGRGLGKDVKICPCKTMVPLYRAHVFGQIKPATNSRVDFGFCLTSLRKTGKSVPKRLIDTGGFKKKDRITHRVELTSPGDIDDFVTNWLQRAYNLDAPD